MKQRYTVTIADLQMNVITEEPAEAVESVVGIIDRRIREIHTASSRCSKTEAALLCALDYCSEKIKAQRKVQRLEGQLADCEVTLDIMRKNEEKLNARISELEALLAKR